MQGMYDRDPRFKEYVDRYAAKMNITVNEALTHALIRSAAEYYKGLNNDAK